MSDIKYVQSIHPSADCYRFGAGWRIERFIRDVDIPISLEMPTQAEAWRDAARVMRRTVEIKELLAKERR